jgi:hypothetical protein
MMFCKVETILYSLVSGERKIPDIGIGALDCHCFVLLRIKGHDPIPGRIVRELFDEAKFDRRKSGRRAA